MATRLAMAIITYACSAQNDCIAFETDGHGHKFILTSPLLTQFSGFLTFHAVWIRAKLLSPTCGYAYSQWYHATVPANKSSRLSSSAVNSSSLQCHSSVAIDSLAA
jgi:hypothetical protein